MNVKVFVSGSAALLTAWLGVTYFREVPGESYPTLGRSAKPLSAKVEEPKPAMDESLLQGLATVEVK
ncbi:hypothetical protein HNR46_001669 [Haloferula luteola]|uniref:Uncharacterized protein n=1 Tax=Haloferula luteola TaxID=595692 RepID=A0A840V1Y5_9BACT|nr:hypothetical protein [Haloferula luteola]MBB5351433.1 hypothetical protein [Haloferula luteola]